MKQWRVVSGEWREGKNRNTQGKLKSYKDLLVWQKSMALVKDIYGVTRSFPQDEPFGLVSQLRRAAVSVPSNIAEGQSRHFSISSYASAGPHHQGGELFPLPRGCRGMSCGEDGTGNPKDTPLRPPC